MKKFVAGAAAVALTACAPASEQDPSIASGAGTEVSQRHAPQPRAGEELPDPPAPPPPGPPALPGLMPLSEAQVRAELGSGASCALSDGGPPVMVLIVGDAVVGAGAVVSRHEGKVARDASVNIVRGRRGFGVSHRPRWVCGS